MRLRWRRGPQNAGILMSVRWCCCGCSLMPSGPAAPFLVASSRHPTCKSSCRRAQMPCHVRHALLSCSLPLACCITHTVRAITAGRGELQAPSQRSETGAHLSHHETELVLRQPFVLQCSGTTVGRQSSNPSRRLSWAGSSAGQATRRAAGWTHLAASRLKHWLLHQHLVQLQLLYRDSSSLSAASCCEILGRTG